MPSDTGSGRNVTTNYGWLLSTATGEAIPSIRRPDKPQWQESKLINSSRKYTGRYHPTPVRLTKPTPSPL